MTDSLDRDELARRERQLIALDQLSQRFGQSLSAAFAKGTGEGRRLDGVLSRLQRSLLTATLRSAIKPVRSGLESLFKGAAGDGEVTPFARGGVVSRPTYFPMQGSLGLMGEAGAEAILPLARGPDGRLGVRAGGTDAPVSVTVNIAAQDMESFRRSEAQVSAALARAVGRGRRAL